MEKEGSFWSEGKGLQYSSERQGKQKTGVLYSGLLISILFLFCRLEFWEVFFV